MSLQGFNGRNEILNSKLSDTIHNRLKVTSCPCLTKSWLNSWPQRSYPTTLSCQTSPSFSQSSRTTEVWARIIHSPKPLPKYWSLFRFFTDNLRTAGFTPRHYAILKFRLGRISIKVINFCVLSNFLSPIFIVLFFFVYFTANLILVKLSG